MWTQLAANVCILILFCLHSVNFSFFLKSLRMSQVIRSDRKEGRPRGGRHNRNLLIRRMRRDKKLRFRSRPESGVCRDKKKKRQKLTRRFGCNGQREEKRHNISIPQCGNVPASFSSSRMRRPTRARGIGGRPVVIQLEHDVDVSAPERKSTDATPVNDSGGGERRRKRERETDETK